MANNAERLAESKLKYEGHVFTSNDGGEFVIVRYTSKTEVLVRFIASGYEKLTSMSCIRRGCIKDKLRKGIFGVGISDLNVALHSNPEVYRLYSLWCGMLERCYDENSRQLYPAYNNCYVDQSLHSFTNFYECVKHMVGHNSKDLKSRYFQMDKDLLSDGKKVYSKNTICFLPHEINAFLTNRKSLRGKLPLGVSLHKKSGKYKSSLTVDGKSKHIGLFVTPEEAFHAYKAVKEQHAKVLANKWKDKIDPRAYEALMKWNVDITD